MFKYHKIYLIANWNYYVIIYIFNLTVITSTKLSLLLENVCHLISSNSTN